MIEHNKELLELAASAAGYELSFSYDDESEGLPYKLNPSGGATYWNPYMTMAMRCV